ncbi:ABC transporter ATP-binding protein [Algoriphagus sp.]|uniref:ABC transporter ATP-binding protein n=1 Tax=Algoriphagus sp. TaxID=1872435 RepID=UPI003284D02C
MSNSVIKVENLSKRYRLGLKENKSETLAGQIGNLIKSPWQNFKKLHEMSRFGSEDESVFWALKDLNFEVREGEVLGIIGKNGAGKSTLLKILSGITDPTAGKVEIHAQVASLLEVGTGFHPELSGRENIYMNGTILGMSRKEIDSKLDEIIDFSGVEKFIDTSVKFYSSGMKVRLGFSIAAHLEPEILIIDEVLAVGDFEFQKKCLGKMEEVSGQGRTVLFVSHNMQAVSTLTQKCIYLENGEIVIHSDTKSAISKYLQTKNSSRGKYSKEPDPNINEIITVNLFTSNFGHTHHNGEQLKVDVEISLFEGIKNGNISIQICNSYDVPIIHSWIFNDVKPILHQAGIHRFSCVFPSLKLYQGEYYCRIILASNNGNHVIQVLDKICLFDVVMYEQSRAYRWEKDSCAYIEDFYWQN